MPPGSPSSSRTRRSPVRDRPLAELLGGGDRRSIGDARRVARAVLRRPVQVREIVKILGGHDPLLRARAAHVLMTIARKRPDLVRPFRRRLLGDIGRVAQWEVREQTAKILPLVLRTGTERAQAMRLFEEYLRDPSSVVRACGMQAMADIAMKEPALRAGVLSIIEALTDVGTPAMRARGRKLLPALRRLTVQ